MDGSNSVWQMISVEVEGPFQVTPLSNQYVVILTDLCSKWIEMKALAEKTAAGVAGFVMSIFARMGFAECKFYNMDPTFEKEVRQAIHTQGSPFVRNVAKFSSVLDRIWNDEIGTSLDEKAVTAAEDAQQAAEDGGTEVTVLETGEILYLQGVIPKEPEQRGHHTERFLRWVGANLDTWDTDLDGYLFKLRMGGAAAEPDNGDPEGETTDEGETGASPFDVIYAGRHGPNPATPRGRGRPRGRPRGSGLARVAVVIAPRPAQVPVEGRRPRGRPRKVAPPLHYDLVPIDPVAEAVALLHDEGGGGATSVAASADEETPVTPRRSFGNYGLRTTLKASVKTNMVQRMLKRSASKRSGIAMPPHVFKKPKAVSSYSDNSEEEEEDDEEEETGSDAPESILGLENAPDGNVDSEDETWGRKIVKRFPRRKRGRPRNPLPRGLQVRMMQRIGLQAVRKMGLHKTLRRIEMAGVKRLGAPPSLPRKAGRPPKVRRDPVAEGDKSTEEAKDGEEAVPAEAKDGEEAAPAESMEEGEEGAEETNDEGAEATDELDVEEEEEEEEEDDEDDEVDENEDIENEPKVSCPSCPGVLLREKELAVHATFHRDDSKLLHCLYCTAITGTWEHMQEHLVGHIGNDASEATSSMLKKMRGLRGSSLMARRMRRKELAGTIALRCTQCVNVRMATATEQRVHQSCHREDSRLLRCPHCTHVAGTWPQMQEHLAAHPDEVPAEVYQVPIEEKTCGRCHRVFDSPEMRDQHLMVYHARERKFMCDTCGKTFKERKSIIRHQELHANVIYQCDECPYKTKIQRDYLDHQRIHKGMGFNCTLCEKVFSRQSQLHLHLESHRKDKGVVICDQCGHQANGMAALRHHVRIIHGVPQSWPCSLCIYVGKTKSNLKGHTDRIHNKKFKCPHCEFATLAECTLLKHVDIFHNEGERRFPCPHCLYRAREPKCLTEHIRVLHNPLAPKFPCEFCGIEFKTKSMLRDHMPQHTGQRFMCNICQYIAKYRSILYRHVKKRHPGRTLADVMQNTEPKIVVTPSGKPILPPKSRAPRRKFIDQMQRTTAIVTNLGDGAGGLEIDIANMQESEGVGVMEGEEEGIITVHQQQEGEEEDEESTVYITQEQVEMLSQIGDGGNMYITSDGGTLSLDQDGSHLLLDPEFLQQAAAGGVMSLPNNLRLQIISKDQSGGLTMQVLSNDGEEEGGEVLHMVGVEGTVEECSDNNEGMRLMLVAEQEQEQEVDPEDYQQEHCIVMM